MSELVDLTSFDENRETIENTFLSVDDANRDHILWPKITQTRSNL